MKILSIIATAYGATLEQQDDTTLWLNHSLTSNGADVTLLLRADAVNYALRRQGASGLNFEDQDLARPPQPDKDLEKLIESDVAVYVIQEDLRQCRVPEGRIMEALKQVSRGDMLDLLDRFDEIWHW